MTHEEYEKQCHADLAARIADMKALSDEINTAAQTQGAIDVVAIMKALSHHVQECQKHIESHANGEIRLTDDLLKMVAQALHEAQQCMHDVVFFDAMRKKSVG